MNTKHTTKSKSNHLTGRREPFGFMLWLGLFGSGLLFTSLFIIYLSSSEKSFSYYLSIPDLFWLSTLVMLFSSITLHEANLAFIQERFLHYRVFLGTTLALGTTFIFLQIGGWLQLMEGGTLTNLSNSTSFVYILTGLHLLHILGGVIYLAILFKSAIKNRSYVDSFVYSVNAPNRLKIKLASRYWHFVDALWLIIFLCLVVLYH